MFGIDPLRLAAILAIAHAVSVLWVWSIVSRLRSTRGVQTALPADASFFTSAIVLWLWSDQHRRLNDKALSLAIYVTRALLALCLMAFVASIFLRS